MKQTLSLVLALLLLAGCAAKQPAAAPEQAPGAAAPGATEEPVVIDSSQSVSATVRLEKAESAQYASGTDLYVAPDVSAVSPDSGTDYYASPTDLPDSEADSGTEYYASPTDLPAGAGPASDETPIDYSKVYTDSSKYEPHAVQAKYTRLREEDMTEFVPMEDLGTVLPYAASNLFSGKEARYGYADNRSYGLMDASGRLLTDGVYSSVSPILYTERYYDFSEAALPFWQVTQLSETVRDSESGAVYGGEVYGVVSMDGSFALPPAYYSIESYADGFVARGGEHRFEVYDREGTLLFNGDALEDMDFPWDWSYGEGLFTLSKDDEGYYFVDRSGKTVLGPYDYADAFSEGLACVREKEDEKYGYIDAAGAWVIQPQFENRSRFEDGQAVQRRDDGRCVVIDRTGAELLRLDNAENGLIPCPFGYEEFTYAEEIEEHDFYDRQGNVRVHGKAGEVWKALDDRMIALIRDDAVELRSLHTPGWGLRAEGASFDVSCGAAMIDGKSERGYLLKTNSIYAASSFRYYFVTQDLSEVRELQYGCYADSDQTLDPVTGEPYSECVQGDQRYFYGRDGRLIGSCRNDADAAVIGGMLRVTTDRACTYTDANGETVFCFPLLSILDS